MVRCQNKQVICRLSIVNFEGHVIFDELIKPEEKVDDYISYITGINQETLHDKKPYSFFQKQILDIIKDRIIIGHSIINDFKVIIT